MHKKRHHSVWEFLQQYSKAVPVLDKGVVDAVGHHVHRTDAEHGAVHVIAEEHVIHVVVFLLAIEEDLFFSVFFQILARWNKKTGGAAGRIYKDVIFDTSPVAGKV